MRSNIINRVNPELNDHSQILSKRIYKHRANTSVNMQVGDVLSAENFCRKIEKETKDEVFTPSFNHNGFITPAGLANKHPGTLLRLAIQSVYALREMAKKGDANSVSAQDALEICRAFTENAISIANKKSFYDQTVQLGKLSGRVGTDEEIYSRTVVDLKNAKR